MGSRGLKTSTLELKSPPDKANEQKALLEAPPSPGDNPEARIDFLNYSALHLELSRNDSRYNFVTRDYLTLRQLNCPFVTECAHPLDVRPLTTNQLVIGRIAWPGYSNG